MGKKENRIHFPIDYTSRLIKDFKVVHKEALDILDTKPMSGIDSNLYVLDNQETEVCKECLEKLKII